MQSYKILLLVGVLLLASCVSSNSGSVYKRDEARHTQTVKTGVIESVRQVQIEGTQTPIGAAAGGVIGGIAGGTVGGDKTRSLTAAIGGLVGAIIGSATEELATRKDGIELTVQIDGGQKVVLVQEDDEVFNAGDRVRIIENGTVSRVSH